MPVHLEPGDDGGRQHRPHPVHLGEFVDAGTCQGVDGAEPCGNAAGCGGTHVPDRQGHQHPPQRLGLGLVQFRDELAGGGVGGGRPGGRGPGGEEWLTLPRTRTGLGLALPPDLDVHEVVDGEVEQTCLTGEQRGLRDGQLAGVVGRVGAVPARPGTIIGGANRLVTSRTVAAPGWVSCTVTIGGGPGLLGVGEGDRRLPAERLDVQGLSGSQGEHSFAQL